MSQLVRIEVDADNVLTRQFTQLERENLAFAVMQATNATAFGIREAWATAAPRVFDRPTPLTVKAAQYEKATKARPFAVVKLRDEATKGTPPARYLLAQVQGGVRAKTGLELLLQAKGVMPPGMFAVPGKGAQLDAFGNMKRGQVRQVLSQLQAGREAGYTSNESEASRDRRRKRNAKRGVRGGEYFAVPRQRGRLGPGVYERIQTGFGSAVRAIYRFVRGVSYRPRYDIFGLAQRQWNKLMPFHFEREIAKALESSKYRGRR